MTRRFFQSALLVLAIMTGISFTPADVLGQQDTTIAPVQELYVITKNDGTQYVGKLISQDEREVLIETKELGRLYIPKHEIKSIRPVKAGELNGQGEYVPTEVFATRYFLTTNGFMPEKGKHYIRWTLGGIDVQFAVTDRITAGIITSWVGIPIIGSAKYSVKLGENVHGAVGFLAGTGSWAAPDYAGVLPYGALTFGTPNSNLNLSAGYVSIFGDGESESRTLLSASMFQKIGPKAGFVLDSVILPVVDKESGGGAAIIVPGVRLSFKQQKAFQFGFAAIYAEGEFLPVPIPMLSLFQAL